MRVVASAVPDSCDPIDCSLPGSSVHGILQERILKWVAISFSTGLDPGIEPASPALTGSIFTNSAIWEALNIFIQFSSVQSLSHVLFFATL